MKQSMLVVSVLLFSFFLLGCQNLPAESAVGPNDSSSKSAIREYAIGWDVNSFQPVMVSYPESQAEQDAKEWAQESLDIEESGKQAESGQNAAIPYDISKSNFTQERWGTIFYSDYWIANRMSVDVGPTPAHRKSWMNVYANQGSWDECVFHREPEQEWYLIQYIGTSEHYVFWTETIPYLEFSEIGDTHWQLYCYDIEKEETRLVLDSEQKKVVVWPEIYAFDDKLSIYFAYPEGYGEVVQYDPRTDEFSHLYYKNCSGVHVYYGIHGFDGVLTSYDYDGENWYALIYDLRTHEGLKYKLPPLHYKTEVIYKIIPMDGWLMYSTSFYRIYAYQPSTGTLRTVSMSDNLSKVNDRIALIYKQNKEALLYDVSTDTYQQISELNLNYAETDPEKELKFPGVFTAPGQVFFYERKLDLDEYPVIQVKIRD